MVAEVVVGLDAAAEGRRVSGCGGCGGGDLLVRNLDGSFVEQVVGVLGVVGKEIE